MDLTELFARWKADKDHIHELQAENARLKSRGIEDMRFRIVELEAESAGRMGRIKKLVALCYEHDIPMNDVLDTGLLEASDE